PVPAVQQGSITGIHPADAPAIRGPDAARHHAIVAIGVGIRPSRISAVDEGPPEGETRAKMAEAEAAMEPATTKSAVEAAMKATAAESAPAHAGRGFGGRKCNGQQRGGRDGNDRAHDTLLHRMRSASAASPFGKYNTEVCGIFPAW